MRIGMFSVLALAAVAFAQTSAPGPDPGGTQLTELKTYLNLTDQQVTSLQNLRTQQAQSLDSLFQQIRTKQTALDQALAAGGASAAAVGQMLIDIQALRNQVSQANQQLQVQAVALLIADQKVRLQALTDAQKLQPSVREAEAVGLLARSQYTEDRLGPRFGPGGFGPGFGMAGRGRMFGTR